MFFILIVFLSAFAIEAIGTLISIIGLSAMFMQNTLVVAMAVALDVGKVVAVSFLYKSWAKINFIMKLYMTLATVVLIMITSVGVFGFLSGEFQKAIAGNNQQGVTITALTEERDRLQKRKEEIDTQIASLPSNFVNGRTKLIKQFSGETTKINDRLLQIDEELPKLKIENIGRAVKIGPILYIAEAFKVTPEEAVKWVIFIIIGVFDPLAVALLIAGNFLWEQRKKSKPKKQAEPTPVPDAPASAPVAPKEQQVFTKDYIVAAPLPSWESQTTPEPEPIRPPEPTPEPAPAPKVIRKKRAPKAAVFQEPIAEEPVIKEKKPRKKRAPKEVVVKESAPIEQPLYRSSLDDSKIGDVSMDDDPTRAHRMDKILSKYKEPDDQPVVSVGGPSGRS